MDIKQLQSHVDSRFDKLEGKLDDYAEQTVKNTQDLTWIMKSGSVVLTLVILPIVVYVIIQFISQTP